MRIKINNKILTSPTSLRLKETMEKKYDKKLTWEEVNNILCSVDNLDIRSYESEDWSYQPYIHHFTREYYLCRFDSHEWEKLFQLYPDETGTICHIYSEDKSFARR